MNTSQSIKKLFSLLVILVLALSACAPALVEPGSENNGGASVWIESPLPERILPNQEITITVYATDVGVSSAIPVSGITAINLWINGVSLGSYQPTPLSGDANNRMVRLDVAWQPPAEGSYVLNAQAVTARGDASNVAVAAFCIVVCSPDEASMPTPTPGLPFDEPPITPTPGVEFYAAPATVQAGECSRVYWAVSYANEVYLDNVMKPSSGSERYCACSPIPVTLTVVGMDGTTQTHTLTIDVTGSCQASTPTPEPDTDGPMLISQSLQWSDCSFFGYAEFYDPSGVAWAEFHYSLNEQGWGWIQMNPSGSGWISQVGVSVMDGIGTPMGTIQYQFRALDSLGNETWSSSTEYFYMSCSG